GADRAEHVLGELLCLDPLEVEGELDDERLLDSELGEELQPPVERREQLDAVAHHPPGMRMERDHGRARAGGDGGVDHAPVSEMDPVERPERDGPVPAGELLDGACDLHDRVPVRAGAGSTTRPTATSRPSCSVRTPSSA